MDERHQKREHARSCFRGYAEGFREHYDLLTDWQNLLVTESGRQLFANQITDVQATANSLGRGLWVLQGYLIGEEAPPAGNWEHLALVGTLLEQIQLGELTNDELTAITHADSLLASVATSIMARMEDEDG